MESSDFKIIKRFGPSVLKVKIPENIIKTLNNHFDKLILNKDESKRLNHGEDLVGDVTQELKLEKEIMVSKSKCTNSVSLAQDLSSVSGQQAFSISNIQHVTFFCTCSH